MENWSLQWDLLSNDDIVKFIELNIEVSLIDFLRSNYYLENLAQQLYMEEDAIITEEVESLEKTETKLEDLGFDMLISISKGLEYKDLINLCSSNRQISEFCEKKEFWRYYIFANYGINIPEDINYMKIFLRNKGTIPFEEIFQEKYQYLKDLTGDRSENYEYLKKIALNNKEYYGFDENKTNFIEDFEYYKYYIKLDFGSVEFRDYHFGGRIDIKVELNDISMLTNLTELYLGRNNQISDISMLTNLRILSLGGNRQISNILSLINLEELYLKNNNNIENISTLKNLRILHIGNNRILSDISSLNNIIELNTGSNRKVATNPKNFSLFKSIKRKGGRFK